MNTAFQFRFDKLYTNDVLGQVVYITSQGYRHYQLICKPQVDLFIS